MYNRRKTVALCLLLAGLLLLCAACSPDETPSLSASVQPSVEPSAEPTTEPSVEPSIEPSADVSDDTIVTYSESEKRRLEWSAENDDKPKVSDDGTGARLYVLKSVEQLAELEAIDGLEELYIELANIDLTLASPTLKMIQFDGEFLSSDALAIDLSGCTALTEASLYLKQPPRELKLPDSLEELKMGSGLAEYADYLSTLPNLRKLTPGKVFDLSLLNDFDSLEHLTLFGSTSKNHWDLSVLTNKHIAKLQLDSQETLDTFVGLEGLRSVYVNDLRISDISRIVEYAPNLETLVIRVPESSNEVIWRGDIVDLSNVELLDSLETPIPIEQLKAVVANGGRLCIWGDPNR